MACVLQIGAGGVGGVVAHKMAQNREVFSRIILASRTLDKCKVIADSIKQKGLGEIEIDCVDADSVESMVALIEKYKGIDVKGRLFPFISPQRYNDAIKEIFRLCGITRLVTVLDSVTEEEVQRPINEVAASHMARKTFIGNLYKRVKDPNLIGSMSGHVEGSRAFARYREIDDDLKREVVSLID